MKFGELLNSISYQGVPEGAKLVKIDHQGSLHSLELSTAGAELIANAQKLRTTLKRLCPELSETDEVETEHFMRVERKLEELQAALQMEDSPRANLCDTIELMAKRRELTMDLLGSQPVPLVE